MISNCGLPFDRKHRQERLGYNKYEYKMHTIFQVSTVVWHFGWTSGLYLENDKKRLIKNLCTLEVSSFSIVPINSKLQATQPRCHARFDGRESLSAFMENQFGTIMASRAFSASYAVLFICQIELWSVGHRGQNNIKFFPLKHYCLKYCCWHFKDTYIISIMIYLEAIS